MRRLTTIIAATVALLAAGASAAYACGSLIGPNGAVNLLRTSTLAAYHDGVEHYVTSFEYAGAEGNFGSIVPLPDVPTKVERGGDWTLQRLQREVAPPVPASVSALAAEDGARSATVILKTKIDALDITILEGGADQVVTWSRENGFDLPLDTPEILAFYARRSPYFMAARFDAAEAARRGQSVGDGTPIHLTIPTDDPWVPLRILAAAKGTDAPVEADVFLLTDREPVTLPAPINAADGRPIASPALILDRSEQASGSLLDDLRSDKGMGWIPDRMWLSYVQVRGTASQIDFDLAIDVSGAGAPSPVDAGIGDLILFAASSDPVWPFVLAAGFAIATAMILRRQRPAFPAA